ncbi:MAG: MFS transporter [Acidobacteria bacterium]|nr:MFS transporter [Acidobacteriota bacterium]
MNYWRPVWALCVTQVVSWGTLYYAFSVLLGPMGAGHGWSVPEMVGAFSGSLLVTGICAYPAGKTIRRFGGPAVMSTGSAVGSLALLTVAFAPSLSVFYAGWAIAGVAMATTLYEAAFAALAAIYDEDYKRAVTFVTFAGGFASTVFWPLTERLTVWAGWRDTLLLYAGLHLLVCLPLHRYGLPHVGAADVLETGPGVTVSELLRQTQFLLLGISMTLYAVVFSVISVHLIPLLQAKGASLQQAAWLAAVAGPMQVIGRLIEYRFGDRWPIARTGTLALLAFVPAVAGLMVRGAPVGLLLLSVGLYGMGNGVVTIARSVSIVELFGRDRYAQVSGALAAPSTVARAFAPFLASLLLAWAGGYSGVLAIVGVLAGTAAVLFGRANRS